MHATGFHMKHSIRRQFALIFIGLMMAAVFLCWLINIMFLEEYYIRSRTDVILAAYESIRQAANSDTYNTDEFTEELDDICGVYNITIYVMDMDSQVRYVSVNGGEELEKRLMAYLFGILTETTRVIREEDGYVVQRVRTGILK